MLDSFVVFDHHVVAARCSVLPQSISYPSCPAFTSWSLTSVKIVAVFVPCDEDLLRIDVDFYHIIILIIHDDFIDVEIRKPTLAIIL